MMSKSNVFDVVKRGRGILPTSDKELIGAIVGLIVAVGGSMTMGYISGKAIGDTLVGARIRQEERKNAEIQALLDEVDEALS